MGDRSTRIRRLVIDAEVGHVVRMYVEFVGDERLLDAAIRITELHLQDEAAREAQGPPR